MLKFCKFILYLAILIALAIYTPKILSSILHTPYPIAAVTSGSMWPELKTDDLILMRGIKGKDAQIGQIVIYQNAKGFTIHRLVRKENGKLITKGDANAVEDEPVAEKDVIARAIYIGQKPFRVPKLGKFVQIINARR